MASEEGMGSRQAPTEVVVVILNFNNAEETIQCVDSLANSDGRQRPIIVIDNGSIRSDKIRLESALSQRTHLIALKENVGVAAGWNCAIRRAMESYNPDFVFLLNNDTIVDSGLIDELLLFASSSSSIGAMGPSIMRHDRRGEHQYPRHRGLTKPILDGRLSGCSLMIRMQAIVEVGLFDEDYFAYGEESDFLERINKRGWKTYYVPTKAKVYHKGAETSSRISGFEAYHKTRNRLLFAGKNLEGMRLLANLGSFFFKALPLELCRDFASIDRRVRLRNRARGFIDGLRLYMSARKRFDESERTREHERQYLK